MITDYDRYAVSWIPQSDSLLARFGVAWTGWCADACERRPRMRPGRLPFAPDAVAGDLDRQGFHAVIRAPFRLRAGRSHWLFERELSAVRERLDRFALPRLAVAVVGGRIALVPAAPTDALKRFLETINAALDPFDAGPVAETARSVLPGFSEAIASPIRADGRVTASLTGGFVMPLTRRLSTEEAEALARPLARELEPILAEPIRVGDFALIGDPGQGRAFRVIERFELREGPVRATCPSLDCTGPRLITDFAPGPRAPQTA